MAKQFQSINDSHRDFIHRQRIFFMASAAAQSHVNLSPRGTDGLRILGPNRVAYLDRTGSGNETAAHIHAGGRLAMMFCAFEGAPLILRLYGSGSVLGRTSSVFKQLLTEQFGGAAPPGARQIVMLDVERVQTSCGFGVPLFEYRGERDTLDRWAAAKGEPGMEAYRRKENVRSIDGLPTGLDW
jgi:hypothetical protein